MTNEKPSKVEWSFRLSERASSQLDWLVRALFTSYEGDHTYAFHASATLERAIDDMYQKHVREL